MCAAATTLNLLNGRTKRVIVLNWYCDTVQTQSVSGVGSYVYPAMQTQQQGMNLLIVIK